MSKDSKTDNRPDSKVESRPIIVPEYFSGEGSYENWIYIPV